MQLDLLITANKRVVPNEISQLVWRLYLGKLVVPFQHAHLNEWWTRCFLQSAYIRIGCVALEQRAPVYDC